MASLPASGPAPGTSRLARLVIRLRFVLPVAWIAGAVLATVLLPTIEEAQTGGLGDLVPRDAAAIEAEQRAAELFAFPVLSRTVVVQRDAGGLDAGETARVVGRAVRISRHLVPWLARVAAALPLTNGVGGAGFARERSTTALTYLLFRPDVDRGDREIYANRLAGAIEREDGDAAGVTGAVPARAAQADAVSGALPVVELLTVLLVALVVGAHFRSPLPPLVTLAAIAIAYLVAIRVMAGIGKAVGISVPSEVEPVVVVLLFGIVTDYAVFFITRFSERLGEGLVPRRAAESATAEQQRIVLTAGLIVALASGSLVVAKLGFFQAFGPGMALAVVVGLAVALTFVPACLAIFGAALFWPRRRRAAQPPRAAPRFATVAFAARRPALVAAVTGAVLLAAATGLTRIELGQTLIRGLPADAGARVAYGAAARGFVPGVLSPTVLVVEGEGIAARRAQLERLQRALAERAGVAAVLGPAQQPTEQLLGAVFAPSGDAARLVVVLSHDPLGAVAIAELRSLRAALPDLLERSGLAAARVLVAGDTALAEETVGDARGDIGRVAPVVLLVVVLMLALFLRAAVAPLYLAAASVLGFAAALGVTAYVLDLAGRAELTYFVPFAAAVLLVPLGSDYNVFLIGRIWEEARARPLREAVAVGGSAAAAAITVAGLVLAASFALLAVVPVRAFRELALAMGAGLLIDAFVVRTLLVPALVVLVGERGAWPRRLRT